MRDLGMGTSGEAPGDGTLITLVQMSSTMRTPCCDTPVLGFDGCCAIACNNHACNKHFCAWCFETFNTSGQAHSHISQGRCTVSPDRAYYFETDKKRKQLQIAWRARQFELLANMRRLDLTCADPLA